MAIQIGAKSHSFSDPTGLLSDCHRRVEMFLGGLHAVAERMDSPLTGAVAATLNTALRYFREAAPRHTADEEESLFSRLRRLTDSGLKASLAHLEKLEHQHQQAQPLHDEVDRIGRRYLTEGNLSAGEVAAFRNAIAELMSMYKEHIAMEDSQVFPAASRLLSAEEKKEIADEMARRRNLNPLTEISTG